MTPVKHAEIREPSTLSAENNYKHHPHEKKLWSQWENIRAVKTGADQKTKPKLPQTRNTESVDRLKINRKEYTGMRTAGHTEGRRKSAFYCAMVQIYVLKRYGRAFQERLGFVFLDISQAYWHTDRFDKHTGGRVTLEAPRVHVQHKNKQLLSEAVALWANR